MQNMKKILAGLLVLLMVLALVACGTKTPATDGTDANASTEPSGTEPSGTEPGGEEPGTEPTTEPTTEPVEPDYVDYETITARSMAPITNLCIRRSVTK